MLVNFFVNLANLLFPAKCNFCGKDLEIHDYLNMCLRCTAGLIPSDNTETCGFCGHPSKSSKCPACGESGREHFHFKLNKSLALNEGIFQKLIYDYKFKKIKSFSNVISDLASRRMGDFIRQHDFLAPVPLSKSKKLEREFCQVTAPVRLISKSTGIPVIFPIKKRDSSEKSQHDKSLDQRKSTVHRNFYFVSKFRNILEGKKILLVDDIYTSGSTLNACARILKENSDCEVSAFTFARSVLK